MTAEPQHAGGAIAVGRPSHAGAETSAWLLPLAGILAFGLLLRLIRLDAASFWVDELFSVYWARESFRFLWTDGLRLEANPPLYYALLKGWTLLTGREDEAAIRLFSVIGSVLAIPVVGLIGREFGGRRAGLLAAALFAVAPIQVYYAQEARTYAWLILCLALAMLGLIRFARLAAAGRGGLGWLALYAAAAVTMVYLHATAALLLAALNLSCLGWLLGQPAWRGAVARLVAAGALVVLAATPQILAMIGYLDRRHELDFVGRPDLVRLVNLANSLLVDPAASWLWFREASMLSAVLLGLLAALLWFLRPPSLAAWFLLGVPALFFGFALLQGLVAPVLLPRVIAWMSVPLAVFVALALLSPRPPALLRGAFALALAAATGFGLHAVHQRTAEAKEDWRGLIAELQRRVVPGDILVSGGSGLPLATEVYGGVPAEPLRWAPPGMPVKVFPQLRGWPREVSGAALAEAVAAGRHVFVVMRATDFAVHGPAAVAALPGVPPARVERRGAKLVLLSW